MATNIYHKVICEVYVNGNISNISKGISDFVKVSELLLSFGVEIFYIYSSKPEFNIFKNILNLYKISYPELQIVNRNDESKLYRKANYVVIFN